MSISDGRSRLESVYNAAVDDDQDKLDLDANSVHLLNARRTAALAEIDNARFSWFHFRVALVAGVGFFTDAYDLFAIDIVSTQICFPGNNSLSQYQLVGIKVAARAGNLIGQVLFGWPADKVGRKRMYGLELMFMINATFCQALAGSAPSVGIVGVIIVYRFIMGVGVGGDCPLGAISISAELAATQSRGRFMTAVFAARGWGQFAASAVATICVAAYKNTISNPPNSTDVPTASIDQIWRILIGFGCVPALVALYFRLTVPETPRFTMDIERNVKQATQDIDNVLSTGTYRADRDAPIRRVIAPKATKSDFLTYFLQWKNGKALLGTAYSWFALGSDTASVALNSVTNLELGSSYGMTNTTIIQTRQQIYKTLMGYCVGNLVLSVAGLIPGYWVCFLFIDRWGRKPIQLTGFIALTILFLIMGYGNENGRLLKPHLVGLYVFFYCLAMFFQNFGPNTTTFIIPGEAFPTSTTQWAIILMTVMFHPCESSQKTFRVSVTNTIIRMKILAFVMLTGVISTMLLPETKGRSLEEISNEDQEGFIQGKWSCRGSFVGRMLTWLPSRRACSSQADGNSIIT
ncbi:MFS general substrate transporter [Coniophora puteana RWD-64-598 SS2]|uniref:MFS general substrate transporter n=1 Tax=Coniophora puteana (strain RWD-64-598) TaxID=741705 RepID=A0A5M3MYB6_CONPW|nr:MFS general substrate transporter [Coniophora puteana RWD-64-598 SS2]EIW84099.1 MFS general substrate transporter [Coniophora puteana RWD-64-598 SS2]